MAFLEGETKIQGEKWIGELLGGYRIRAKRSNTPHPRVLAPHFFPAEFQDCKNWRKLCAPISPLSQ